MGATNSKRALGRELRSGAFSGATACGMPLRRAGLLVFERAPTSGLLGSGLLTWGLPGSDLLGLLLCHSAEGDSAMLRILRRLIADLSSSSADKAGMLSPVFTRYHLLPWPLLP